jgi:hypothetical protein
MMTSDENNCGVFSRNHEKYLKYAVEQGELDPRRLVTFRSSAKWATAERLLHDSNELPIYFAVVDQGSEVQFKAWLREIVLQPGAGDPASERLLQAAPPDTEGERLWSGKVETLYAISGCYRLEKPFPISVLRKLTNNEPIAEDFKYSYALVRAAKSAGYPEAVASDLPEPPGRIECRVSRIVRNTAIVQKLKHLHDNRCQRCNLRLELADGSGYSEGHHLKPLGGQHCGPDVAGNLVIVCPNCHVLLDFCAVEIDQNNLRSHPGHVIETMFLEYHNAMFRSTAQPIGV